MEDKTSRACVAPVSRRQFVEGAMLGATAAGALGVVRDARAATVASDTKDVAASARKATGTASTAGGTADARGIGSPVDLNPQDYDYTGCSITDFSKTTLFSNFSIGKFTFHHRMVKSAAFQLAFFANNPDEYFAYYERMAKGGVECIWIEDAANFWDMTASPLKQDFDLYDWQGLTDALRADGAVMIGYQFDTMGAPIGPLDYTAPFVGDYTTEEVRGWQQAVIQLAQKLQANGFDAIELNMAANNVGQSFLSRVRNNRTDEYGPQTLESRTRWAVETIRGIKAACGDDFVVQALINGVEENDDDLGNDAGFTTIEETQAIARILQDAGVDSLHVRIGPGYTHIAQFAGDLYFCARGLEGMDSRSGRLDFSRHFQGLVRGDHSGCGLAIDIAAKVREAVTIPVGAATYMDPAQAPDYFEDALASGKLDFLMMNRPLCVDPAYVNKLREGRIDEIAPCTRCLHCFYDPDKNGTVAFEHCRVNAANWRAYGPTMPEGYDPAPAEKPLRVMVAGGGPAGMEAARVAAQRGHEVTLYERADELGGLLPIAEAIKGPHENLGRLATYLARELEVCGVKVVTGTEVTPDLVDAEKPDVVIQATGGVEPAHALTSTTGTKVATFADVPGLGAGHRVVVLGGSARAVDTATYLLATGNAVTIVTPDPMELFEKGHSVNVRGFVRNALTSNGVRIWPGATDVAVGDGVVTFTDTDAGVTREVPADVVVDMSDLVADTSLADALAGTGVKAVAVGDCADPWNIAEAILSANLAARAI